MSKVFSLKRVQEIPITIDEAWKFFSTPHNLERITPNDIKFSIIGDKEEKKMYAGQMISYIIKPILGIPIYWLTEITHVNEPYYFTDEQRVGPYKLWHHQHHFKSIENGVEMIDIVHYRMPLGFIGRFANALFIRKKLHNIFKYRQKTIEEHFGKMP